MLIPCPECGTKVSDRAAACVSCGFPISEHVAQQRAAEEAERERTSRRRIGEVDCHHCDARGFVMIEPSGEQERQSFTWCTECKHTGRLALVESSGGYWAVSLDQVDSFVAGDDVGDHALHLGSERPEQHRYEQAGPLHDD